MHVCLLREWLMYEMPKSVKIKQRDFDNAITVQIETLKNHFSADCSLLLTNFQIYQVQKMSLN
jgi:hypothetical protein